MPWRDAVHIAASIAEGLAAAHARGVIHRDLKPENVFLTNDGAVKILDFGLALRRLELPALDSRRSDARAHAPRHVVLGTLGYMSPEQVTGDRVDGRSDVFALGCVLYEMLSGRALFAGSTPQEIVAQLMHDRVPELSGFDAVAPKAAPRDRVALHRAHTVETFRLRERRGDGAARAAQRIDCGRLRPQDPDRAASPSGSCHS